MAKRRGRLAGFGSGKLADRRPGNSKFEGSRRQGKDGQHNPDTNPETQEEKIPVVQLNL